MDIWPLNKRLWAKVPDMEDVLKIVHIFGFRDLEDFRPMTRQQMKSEKVFDSFYKNLEWIKSFYLQCKQKRYFENIENNEKKIITVFRHFLKEVGYQFITIEKSIDSKKILIYHLEPMKIDQCFQKQKWIIEHPQNQTLTVNRDIFWIDLSND